MTRTRTVLVAISCLSVLALGACSDDDPEPKFAPTPSESTSTEPSPSPTGSSEPALPAAATERSDAGAEAFVRYFLEVLNFAQRTGETRRLDVISTSRCAACHGYVEAINKAYRSGGRVEGGQIHVRKLRELPKDYGADWGAYAHGTATAQVIYDGNGGRKSYPGGRFDLYAYATWVNGGWAMQWMRTPS